MSTLVLFRKCLRFHDHPALIAAARAVQPPHRLLFAFVYDENDVHLLPERNVKRAAFLRAAVADLAASARRLRQSLLCVDAAGDYCQAVLDLVDRYDVKHVFTELEAVDPYHRAQQERLAALLPAKRGATFERCASNNLADPRRLAAAAKTVNTAPLTYAAFVKLFEEAGGAQTPLPTPKSLPPPPVSVQQNNTTLDDIFIPAISKLITKWTVALKNDGFVTADAKNALICVGGESEGLLRLRNMTSDARYVTAFEKPKSSPFAQNPQSTTLLSPYLQFGCVSARLFYARLRAVEQRAPRHTAPPVSLVGQLLWREFFMFVAAAVGKTYAQVKDNPVSRQIPWRDDAAKLRAWRLGRTGYPLVDAIMRALRRDGWIHHLARHVAACFATRGDLWLSWAACAAVFEEELLDADFALNSSNWLWLSASGFFHKYYRVYSPVAFGAKYGDEAVRFVRAHVPELAAVADRHALEPWKAPIAASVIGDGEGQYPARIVEHDAARQENLDRMARAYKNAAQKAKATGAVPFSTPFPDNADDEKEMHELYTYLIDVLGLDDDHLGTFMRDEEGKVKGKKRKKDTAPQHGEGNDKSTAVKKQKSAKSSSTTFKTK